MTTNTTRTPEMSWVNTGEVGGGGDVGKITESMVTLSVSNMRPDIEEVECGNET